MHIDVCVRCVGPLIVTKSKHLFTVVQRQRADTNIFKQAQK